MPPSYNRSYYVRISRHSNSSRPTEMIPTVFRCKLCRRRVLLPELCFRSNSGDWKIVASLGFSFDPCFCLKMHNERGEGRGSEGPCARFSSTHEWGYLPLESGKNYFLTEIVYLFLIFFFCAIIFVILWILNKICFLRLFMNKLLEIIGIIK